MGAVSASSADGVRTSMALKFVVRASLPARAGWKPAPQSASSPAQKGARVPRTRKIKPSCGLIFLVRVTQAIGTPQHGQADSLKAGNPLVRGTRRGRLIGSSFVRSERQAGSDDHAELN